VLIDTDVLIWYLRGNQKAFRVIERLEGFFISVVTYMELVQGMHSRSELNTLKNFLKTRNVSVLQISEDISAKAMFLVEEHYLSHSIQLADALVGATAAGHGLPLLTANTKHYKIIPNLMLKTFRP
jgi:predicted nucleic acid-binding protein